MIDAFSPSALCLDDLRTEVLREDRAVAMIPDESVSPDPEAEAPHPLLRSANDGGTAAAAIDPLLLIIARAIGRQIAREQLDELPAANDDTPDDER